MANYFPCMVNGNAFMYWRSAVIMTVGAVAYYFGKKVVWKYDLSELKEDTSEIKKT